MRMREAMVATADADVALRDKVAKLEAPMSDEEWESTKNWPKESGATIWTL